MKVRSCERERKKENEKEIALATVSARAPLTAGAHSSRRYARELMLIKFAAQFQMETLNAGRHLIGARARAN